MSYDYATERPRIFTEGGTAMLVLIRDNVRALLKQSGAVRMLEAIRVASGDTWTMLACVDYMVERFELHEVTKPGEVSGQYRVFVGGL